MTPGPPAREVTLERACSRLSAVTGESLRGTASTVRHLLLIEQPGAWGREALLESDLPQPLARWVKAEAAALSLRVVLIRKPGGGPKTGPRSAYLVQTGPSESWHRRYLLDSPEELQDIDLRVAMHDSAGATDRPLYLVCTNGKHDLCCATAGVPLARQLSGLGDVWECSHIGGDRFAANLVCLPEGLYYGRVTPDIGVRILERHARGELLLTHLRGRSCYDFGAQAADIFVRQARALHRIDDLALESSTGDGRHVFRTRNGEVMRVAVTVSASAPRRLTCNGDSTAPPEYRVRWDRA